MIRRCDVMRKNELIIWNPDEKIPKKILLLDGIFWSEGGFKIVFCEEKFNIEFHFEGFVLSFRSTNEQFMLKFRDCYGELKEKNKNFNYSWSLFKVRNSEYLHWFSKQHYSMYENIDNLAEHYLFVTEDEIIEVLNDKPPKIILK